MMTPRGEAGFTLVELLVTLVLLSLITLVIREGLEFGAAAWKRSDDSDDRIRQLAQLQAVMARTLAVSYPLWRQNGQGITFDGQSSGVRFMAPAPQALGGNGLARYVLQAQGSTLTLTAAREFPAQEQMIEPSILLSSVQKLEFSYFGGNPGENPSWHSSWTGHRYLPALMRIHVHFLSERENMSNELIFVPRIEVDSGCRYDALTEHCQGR